MSQEQWNTISAFPDYKVSTFGRIKRGKNSIVPISLNNSGYYQAKLWKDDEYRWFYIHRLVGIAFIANPGNTPQIDHINRVRTDNRLENLRWATAKENCANRVFKNAR